MTHDANTSVAKDLAANSGPVQNSKNKRNRIHYVNQGIRAKKSFFLSVNIDDDLYKEIGDEVHLLGKVLAIPRNGSKLRTSIS